MCRDMLVYIVAMCAITHGDSYSCSRTLFVIQITGCDMFNTATKFFLGKNFKSIFSHRLKYSNMVGPGDSSQGYNVYVHVMPYTYSKLNPRD